ncbi:hypothetical protein AB0L40_22750 [Patulibacter sp. NPDC049589]|uniref:hypothetical protein n=1 Tax=Patulibacter sp. NPDC049589 TaxID=3154731 RepID=UPI003419B409
MVSGGRCPRENPAPFTPLSQFCGRIAVVPPVALAGGLGGALVIGAAAGLWPAVRAAWLSPVEALRSA